MSGIDLNDLAVFVRVIDGHGFTAAANALGVPKSSVSRAVSRLEEALGVRLLQRTTRKITPTDAGRALHERVREQVAALADATSEVADLGKVPRGVVRVTAPPDVGIAFLAAVARFVELHPQVRVELSLTNRVVDLVEEGFDLAIRATRAMSDSSLVGRKLASSTMGLFASRSYLDEKGRPTRVDDLARHACVLFRSTSGRSEWRLEGPDGEEVVEVRGAVSADDMSFIARAIAANAGIGMLPLFFARDRKELVRVLPKHSVRLGVLRIVIPSARHEPTRAALFREFLVDYVEKNVRA